MRTARTTMTVLSALTLSLTGTAIAHANPVPPPQDSIASSVVSVDGNMECSGAMISPSWAMTSRYCVTGQDTVPVTVGINQDEGTYTANVVEHGNNDLALLNIDGVHTGTVAALPSHFPEVGVTGMIAGFGSPEGSLETATGKSAHIDARFDWHGPVGIVTQDQEQFFHHTPAGASSVLYHSDTGAPVFIGDEIHGIVSHGWMNDQGEFTQSYSATIADEIDWVRMITGIDGDTWWTMAEESPSGPGDIYADRDTEYPDEEWNTGYVSDPVTDTGPWRFVRFPTPDHSWLSAFTITV